MYSEDSQCFLFQDKLYSGSHNTIEIWDALSKFNLRGKIDHKFGSIHSLAITSQYILAGKNICSTMHGDKTNLCIILYESILLMQQITVIITGK